MELAPTSINVISEAAAKSPGQEPDTPTRIQTLGKPLSFTNGVLKRHHHHHHQPQPPPPAVVTYRECLKNHAASRGGYALDGCGEFMPSPAATDSDPTSIKCAACGCHRNFHRREPEDGPPSAAVIEYQPHHRHHPPPPPPRSPDSDSPPPISSSYYGGHPAHHQPHHHRSSAPHVLLALSTAAPPDCTLPPPPSSATPTAIVSPLSRKRFRTKFTQYQKERMLEFAEGVGWKMQKQDEDGIREFCREIGVERSVLKVWMHNNKNNLVKRSSSSENNNNNNNLIININCTADNNITSTEDHDIPPIRNPVKHESLNGDGGHHYHNNHNSFVTNGSSSSS
ncbi:hypothetical protein SAY87_018982 [Trapa incisa]|uniref:ZF-HD dimerization-type domain-containing protein n=1 Tax=Trapa incisa TaxID=236973 RepID=A0AAN7Q175_9MYRT|nr:hypothetical protein SAY87_018982 [Trapa incisa]